MTELPRDIGDLYLAPVALALQARIDELADLSDKDLSWRVALESDEPDWTADTRRTALLRTVAHLLDLHGWELTWEERGIRAAHGGHALVLGVPTSFRRYVEGDVRRPEPSR